MDKIPLDDKQDVTFEMDAMLVRNRTGIEALERRLGIRPPSPVRLVASKDET